MIYAGIGSRETPSEICNRFIEWGKWFGNAGFHLRSGRARGADRAFEYGCDCSQYMRKSIFVMQDSVKNPRWYDHAKQFHPAWDKCSNVAKALHARNSPIMLGAGLSIPVDFVVCWTNDGGPSGGTGQALRIADAHAIPVFNFHDLGAAERLREFLRARGYR